MLHIYTSYSYKAMNLVEMIDIIMFLTREVLDVKLFSIFILHTKKKKLKINIGDPLEVFVDGDTILLKKYTPTDIFNGSSDDLIEYCGKKVSRASIIELAKLAGYNID